MNVIKNTFSYEKSESKHILFWFPKYNTYINDINSRQLEKKRLANTSLLFNLIQNYKENEQELAQSKDNKSKENISCIQ